MGQETPDIGRIVAENAKNVPDIREIIRVNEKNTQILCQSFNPAAQGECNLVGTIVNKRELDTNNTIKDAVAEGLAQGKTTYQIKQDLGFAPETDLNRFLPNGVPKEPVTAPNFSPFKPQ